MFDCIDPETRRSDAMAEIRRLDTQIFAYWSMTSGLALPSGLRSYRPQHPQNEDDICPCVLCSDWRPRRDEVERVSRFVPDGHRWINCNCVPCAIVRTMQMGLMAVANKRDLWIAMSWQAYTDKAYRVRAREVMTVIAREIENPAYRRGWWSHDGGCVSMEFWLRKVDKALGIDREKAAA